MILEPAQAAQMIAKFLQTFTTSGQLKLRYRVKQKTSKTVDEVTPESWALLVEFSGPDTPLLTDRNGELLNALEHIATKILGLEPDQHHRVSFDADHFKANRSTQLETMAQTAIENVRTTSRPYAFPPMSSRERRELHLLLLPSGLPTASSGEGPGRFVVLYPVGGAMEDSEPARRPNPENVRRAFRHR
jgi:spoIIIJ-associated protein